MSEIIEKWRDSLIDPLAIEFKSIKINKIISYPPAGNDVFDCDGIYKNKATNFFLKVERSKMANFDNEIKIIKLLQNYLPVPKIYESGIYNNYKYIVLSKINGNKLSDILRNSNRNESSYLFLYGMELANIHNLHLKCDKAMQRIVNDYPKIEQYKQFNEYETKIIDYLISNKPCINYDTFIHGDFHYGNILWEKKIINGIIDWEYSGMGFKEQDIAWALILRDTQEFLNTKEEIKQFLNGYKNKNTYNINNLKWCLINGYLHFYLMNKNKGNEEYLKKVKNLIEVFLNENEVL